MIARPLHMIISEIEKRRATLSPTPDSPTTQHKPKKRLPEQPDLTSPPQLPQPASHNEPIPAAVSTVETLNKSPKTAPKPLCAQSPFEKQTSRAQALHGKLLEDRIFCEVLKASPTTVATDLPRPSSKYSMRSAEKANAAAIEAHSVRLRNARTASPELPTSGAPGKAKLRAGSPRGRKGCDSHGLHMNPLLLNSMSSMTSMSSYCAREYSWDHLGLPDFAIPTTARAVQVWERKAQLVEPIWYDCEPRPPSPPHGPNLTMEPAPRRSPSPAPLSPHRDRRHSMARIEPMSPAELSPHRPLSRSSQRLSSPPSLALMGELPERPRSTPSSLMHLEQLSASPRAASRAAYPEHPYRDFWSRRSHEFTLVVEPAAILPTFSTSFASKPMP